MIASIAMDLNRFQHSGPIKATQFSTSVLSQSAVSLPADWLSGAAAGLVSVFTVPSG